MILVTGGDGFIGSNFVLDWLAQTGEPVLNLDRHYFVKGDIAYPAGRIPAGNPLPAWDQALALCLEK